MINLLPPAAKEDFLYARRNAKLLRSCFTLLGATLGVLLITTIGILVLQQSTKTYNNLNTSADERLKAQKLEETQARVDEISNNLKLTTQVLQRQILFSRLLKQIGAAMPNNTSLTDLKISQTQGAIDISAVASSETTATQVQVNLSDPANKIFDRADIESINCSSSASSDARYPCNVDIKARFGANTSFMLIQKGNAQ